MKQRRKRKFVREKKNCRRIGRGETAKETKPHETYGSVHRAVHVWVDRQISCSNHLDVKQTNARRFFCDATKFIV